MGLQNSSIAWPPTALARSTIDLLNTNATRVCQEYEEATINDTTVIPAPTSTTISEFTNRIINVQ